ncbi:RagB/SusD family nutrient uptake outer membrane protein [Chitinophaga sp. 22620]|uniref:RagB/SusD family nutrient uptake outer membrane protein n=1 Tax=Chitinophaga sp. 22620 TaxID=3453952 RepID=UPI003F832825
MKLQHLFQLYILCQLILLQTACTKQDEWLDIKRQNTDVTPRTLSDFDDMLHNSNIFNQGYGIFGLTGTDNLIVTSQNFSAVSETDRNLYIWDKVIYLNDRASLDYGPLYQKILYANLILEGLAKVESSANPDQHRLLQAEALFFRSISYYNLSQTYCKPYSEASAATDAGLVLRSTSDPNVINMRSSVKATYDQMLNDLKTAVITLPINASYATKPNKAAAYGFLAKIYLSMEAYDSALSYSNKALTAYDVLLDYNNRTIINPNSNFRFPAFTLVPGMSNPEVIFYAFTAGTSVTWALPGVQFADSILYRSYDQDDLRKTLIYKDNGDEKVQFWGSYAGNRYNFAGIATNELYLIRAECNARKGNIILAMNDLNKLLRNRYVTGTFTGFEAGNAHEALRLIIRERRKELPFTGQLRWEDLRRLNKDPQFAVTITRVANGITYTLQPNDKRYTLPIPPAEILSGVEQNER